MDSQLTLKQKLSQPESIVIIKKILIDHDYLSRTKIAGVICKQFTSTLSHSKPFRFTG